MKRIQKRSRGTTHRRSSPCDFVQRDDTETKKECRPVPDLHSFGFYHSASVLQRKVTICALVQLASGLNVVLVVPSVTLFAIAHSTASP